MKYFYRPTVDEKGQPLLWSLMCFVCSSVGSTINYQTLPTVDSYQSRHLSKLQVAKTILFLGMKEIDLD